VAVTAFAVALSAAAGRPGPGVVLAGAAVLAGKLPGGWHNDWLDAERDRGAERADKPVAQGLVPRALVGRCASAAVVAVVPLSFASGWRAGLAHLVAVALAWGYNWRLKATLWSWVPYAVSFALLAAFVTLGLPGSPWPPWWALAAAALLGVGAHLANVVPDIADDLAAGVRGLPHALGSLLAVLLALLLLLSASLLIAFGSGRPGVASVIGLVVVASAAVAGAMLARRGDTRVLFRASILIAAADVAMLVARGHAIAGGW
jgi:4-hydroxybenzoate polyprenyltransferase